MTSNKLPYVYRVSNHPILSKVNPYFHEDIQRLLGTNLSREKIIWAGNIGQYGNNYNIYFGYLILLKDRLIRVLYKAEVHTYFFGPMEVIRQTIKVKYVSGNNKRGELGHYVVTPPISPLTSFEIDHKTIAEFAISALISTQRYEDEVEDNKNKKLVEMILDFLPDQSKRITFYSEDESREFLNALSAQKSRADSTKEIGNIADQIKKLAELQQAGMLTIEEYEKAKHKLLDD